MRSFTGMFLSEHAWCGHAVCSPTTALPGAEEAALWRWTKWQLLPTKWPGLPQVRCPVVYPLREQSVCVRVHVYVCTYLHTPTGQCMP